MLKFLDPERGFQEVLLVDLSKVISSSITPEALLQLHKQGMLASPPVVVEGVGTLLFPSANNTASGLKSYLISGYGPMDLNA